MSPSFSTLILMNMLLIVATDDKTNAGSDLVEPASAPINRPDLRQSPVWIRKMKTFFHGLDYDGDGVICQKDFDLVAKRFADQENFDPVQRKALHERSRDRFSLYTKAAGKDIDKGAVLMTEDLLIESVNMQRDDPEFKNIHRAVKHALLDPMKVDQEGYLTYNEYRRYFESLGVVDTSFAQEAFVEVDADNDGRVSFEEYLAASYD